MEYLDYTSMTGAEFVTVSQAVLRFFYRKRKVAGKGKGKTRFRRH